MVEAADRMREAVEEGPTVVAPNQQEAERLLNRVLIPQVQSVTEQQNILDEVQNAAERGLHSEDSEV